MKNLYGILISLFIFLNQCSQAESPGEINSDQISYFKNSYEENRLSFREECDSLKTKNIKAEKIEIPLSYPDVKNLSIDACYIPSNTATKKLVIITSGIHGIEGLAASGIQRKIMHEIVPKTMLTDTGFLFLHAVNPYGQYAERRVSESNIDLNRNFEIDRSLFALENKGYETIQEFLNPSEKLSIHSMGNRLFHLRSVYLILRYGMETLRQAILKGQYQFENGIYFGGKDFVPQKKHIDRLYESYASKYDEILMLDIHTGYGARGKLHLFLNPIKDEKNLKASKEILNGFQIDWGDTGNFYTTTGDFSDYVEKFFPNKTVVRLTAEYGTLDSQTTLGSLKSLHIVIMENQAHHYGTESMNDSIEIKEMFREAYYPSSLAWRTQVMKETDTIFPSLIDRFVQRKE